MVESDSEPGAFYHAYSELSIFSYVPYLIRTAARFSHTLRLFCLVYVRKHIYSPSIFLISGKAPIDMGNLCLPIFLRTGSTFLVLAQIGTITSNSNFHIFAAVAAVDAGTLAIALPLCRVDYDAEAACVIQESSMKNQRDN